MVKKVHFELLAAGVGDDGLGLGLNVLVESRLAALNALVPLDL